MLVPSGSSDWETRVGNITWSGWLVRSSVPEKTAVRLEEPKPIRGRGTKLAKMYVGTVPVFGLLVSREAGWTVQGLVKVIGAAILRFPHQSRYSTPRHFHCATCVIREYRAWKVTHHVDLVM